MLAMRVITPGVMLSMLSRLGACMNSDSTNSSSPFSPIQVTILSSNGTDLTASIPILHSHTSLSQFEQRSPLSVPIKDCPLANAHTIKSWCQHEVSSRDYETFCAELPQAGRTDPKHTTNIGRGKCATDEICVGSNAADGDMTLQAYCVSTNSFVQIGQTPSSVVTAGFNATLSDGNESHLAVEAVFTSVNKMTSLFADSMVLQAQTNDGVWRTVPNGNIYCLRCSSVSLAPFPVTAQRVKVDVVLPEWTPTGLLWLASYPY